MLKQLTTAMLLMLAMLTASARAQEQDPNDDRMAMMQAMQPAFQAIMANMQAKGIDPQEFFQKLMQDGGDLASIQKQLLDQGLIDQKTIDQVQSNVQQVQSDSIKRRLDATDEEWKTLWPLIQRVMKASAAVSGTRGAGAMGGFVGALPPTETDLSRATSALGSALKDPTTSSDQFATVLKDYRDARTKALTELDAAQHDLIATLTVRQEGTLTAMGILE
jgi:hypothetical protein